MPGYYIPSMMYISTRHFPPSTTINEHSQLGNCSSVPLPPMRHLRWLYRHETYTPSPTHSPSTNTRVCLDTGTTQANSKINFRPWPWLQSIAFPARFIPPQCPVRQWPRASKCHRRHRQAAPPPKPFFTKTHAQRQKRGPMPVPRTCRVDTIGATGSPS